MSNISKIRSLRRWGETKGNEESYYHRQETLGGCITNANLSSLIFSSPSFSLDHHYLSRLQSPAQLCQQTKELSMNEGEAQGSEPLASSSADLSSCSISRRENHMAGPFDQERKRPSQPVSFQILLRQKGGGARDIASYLQICPGRGGEMLSAVVKSSRVASLGIRIAMRLRRWAPDGQLASR